MVKLIKDNLKIISSFFKLVEEPKLWLFFLFFGSIMGHLSSLLTPVFAANIISEITMGHASLTYLNIALLGITYTSYNLFWFLNYTSYSECFKYSYKKLRGKIVDKVLNYDTLYQDKISKGEILNTINADTGHLAEMIDSVCEIIVTFLKLLVLIFIFLKTNILIGILVLILDYLYIKAYDICNINSTKYLMGQQKYRDKLTDNLREIMNGLPEIKMFNIDKKMKQNFNVLANKWQTAYMNKRKYVNIRSSILPFIIHFGKAILYLILAYLVFKGKLAINTLILLVSYFEKMMGTTKDLMGYSRSIREWSVSIKRINKILEYNSSETIPFGLNENSYLMGNVEFKNVNFSYKTKNKGGIKNISFKANSHEITALVGKSGSGKTTIINLLLRKYKIDSGNIFLDANNIYDYSKEIYSENIVAVNQSPFIFNMSIKKNLDLIDTNIENQINACKRVGIHNYIMSLKDGYNTVLSENASNFSGGQKQLLAIARTLLSTAEILIFDEVTSSLDTVLNEKIKNIFLDLKKDHTIIVITHKKDVMRLADKIIVLNKGQIKGEGTHQELLKSNKYYQDLQKRKK